MSLTAEQLLSAVLELPELERFELIEALIASQHPSPPILDDALLEVIERRSAEVDSGLVETIPWEEVKRRAHEALNG